MTNFSELALSPALLQALDTLEFRQPTPVQAQTLPIMLEGQDVLAQARTGSGKTAAFGLAMLADLNSDITRLQGLVLCPTRELADQVAKDLRALARFVPNVKILSLCGGVPLRPQLASLSSHEPHIVVGTPGRVQDLIRRKALPLDGLSCVVLDEADRMLDMGFIEPIGDILNSAPTTRKTWLFSATYSDEIRHISTRFQRDAVDITITDPHTTKSIEQRFYRVENADKITALKVLLSAHNPTACLVFCHTRRDTRDVARQLQELGFSAQPLHGEIDQRQRDETVVQFANGSCQVLVATDVASRGLDIKGLPMVIAYELPHDPAVHVHRIGRTGRAGESGLACSLVSGREQQRLAAIEEHLDTSFGWQDLPALRGHKDLPRPAMKTLAIDAGRKDKLRPGDILGALTGSGGLDGKDVGKIDIFATRAYVAVARPQASATAARLRQAPIKGRKIRVREL